MQGRLWGLLWPESAFHHVKALAQLCPQEPNWLQIAGPATLLQQGFAASNDMVKLSDAGFLHGLRNSQISIDGLQVIEGNGDSSSEADDTFRGHECVVHETEVSAAVLAKTAGVSERSQLC